MRLLKIFLIAMFFGACSTPVIYTVDQLNELPDCCTGYSEFEYEKTEIGFKKTTRMHLGQVFSFEEGKSFFLGLEMPGIEIKYLEVTTFHDGSTQVFWPQIMVLDENFNIVRKIENIKLIRNYQFASSNGTTWGNIFKFSGDEKYVVVYSSAKQFGKKMYIASSGNGYAYSAGGGTTIIPSTSYDHHFEDVTPNGMVKLKVLDDSMYERVVNHHKIRHSTPGTAPR